VLKRCITCVVCLCTLLFAAHFATAQELGKVFDDSPTLKLAAPLQWLAVPKGAINSPSEFDNTAKAQGFAPLMPGSALPTSPERDVWLGFALPTTVTPETWYLRIPRSQIEQVTLYFLSEGNRWESLTAGDNIAISRWPVFTRMPSFQLVTHTDRVQTYYLKLEHRTAITERPELINPSEYIDNAAQLGSIAGLMLGLFSLLTLVGLLSARINRSMHFVWFSVMVLMLLLTQLVLIGYAGQRMWPQSIYLNKTMGVIVPLLTIAANTWFVVQVSYAKDAFARIYKVSLALIAMLVIFALAFAVVQKSVPRDALTVLAALAILWNLGVLVWMAWRSQPWLWIVAGGFAPLTLSMLARLAYNFGWLAHIDIAQLVSVMTGCLGMLVVYAGLVNRHRETAAAIARETTLLNTDMSTGLSSARIALTRLPWVLARSVRFEEPCGVIMLHWLDYAKHAGSVSSAQRDAVLSHLGARLRRLARNIDTVARMDDDHFVYLIESPVSHEMLIALSSKILTSCLRPAQSLKDGDAYNVHIAIYSPSDETLCASDVMESLRTRLNQMGQGTQRKVQFVGSPFSAHLTDAQIEVNTVKRSQDVIAKINAIEAMPILPTIATAKRPRPL
jgi:two-component system, sensor histidine kinase LadS